MKIVVLDGYTLNPGDLSWEPLEALGECAIFDRSTEKQTIARAKDAHVIVTNKCPLDKDMLGQLPQLKFIAVTATGFNIVNSAVARELHIDVANVPTYGTRSVAQHAIALLLELTNHVGVHSSAVHAGDWVICADWCFARMPLTELDGLTLGIVGWGRIGQATAEIGRALGMKVIATTRSEKAADDVDFVEVDSLFKTADVISLHCPLTAGTEMMVNAERLALMKPSAFLLNTSRGGLIDETALARALNTDQIAGAALDVLSTEPPKADNPMLTAKHCIITPHNAWASKAARQRLLEITIANVRAFREGNPKNVVN